MIVHFIETDDQYHNGIALEEYEGKYSVVRANKGKDGGTYVKWGYPQGKDRSPIEKSIPWKVELGDKQEAIQILNELLIELDTPNDPVNAPTNDGSDIPF